MKKDIKFTIIFTTIILIIVIGLFVWCGYRFEKTNKQIQCLKPIAIDYCNSLNVTLLDEGIFSGNAASFSVPKTFSCGYKYSERQIGWADVSKYSFLENEKEVCKK